MPADYQQPPRPRGARVREITVIAQAHRAACMTTDKDLVTPIRNAVKLIVKLIDERDEIMRFRANWQDATEGDG